MSLTEAEDSYVTVSVPLRVETMTKIEELRASCTPGKMTLEAMLRVLIETGLIHWMAQAVEDEA